MVFSLLTAFYEDEIWGVFLGTVQSGGFPPRHFLGFERVDDGEFDYAVHLCYYKFYF
jgi:hypothetical protein